MFRTLLLLFDEDEDEDEEEDEDEVNMDQMSRDVCLALCRLMRSLMRPRLR